MAENNPAMPDLTFGPGTGLIRFAIRATILGQAHINYLFYAVTADLLGGAAMRQAAIDLWGNLTPAWTDFLSADWTLQNIVARRVDVYAAPSGFVTGSELAALLQPITGAQGDTCPPQDAAVFRRRTAQAGKRGRGRIFLSGIAEDDHDAGELTVAAVGRAVTLRDALADDFVGTSAATFVPYHVHWVERPVPGVTTLQGRPVDAWDFDTIIRTQRRRQLGHGL